MVETHIDIAELRKTQGGGGGGGDYELNSPLKTINVTKTEGGHEIDIDNTLKEKLITSYESSLGRIANNLSDYNKVEMFRIYYDKDGATGRNVMFTASFRRDYDIIGIADFVIMCGYESNKGGDFLDFNYTEKSAKGDFDITSMIKACRVKNATGKGSKDKQGCVIIYMETTYHWDSVSFSMGARYPDDKLHNSGGSNYDYLGQKFTLPSSSIGTPKVAEPYNNATGDVSAENVSYGGTNVKEELDKVSDALDGYLGGGGVWTDLNLNGTTLSGWWIDSGGKWLNWGGASVRYIEIPSGSTSVKVIANQNYGTYFCILKDIGTPTSGSKFLFADGYNDRCLVLKQEVGEYQLPSDAHYILFSVSSNGVYDQVPSAIQVYSEGGKSVQQDIEELRNEIGGNYPNGISVSFGESKVMFTNSDSDAVDDKYIVNSGQLLRIGDVLYCYYLGSPSSSANESGMYLLSAYSTDGTTWHRGFPSGVTPPVSGTARLFNEGGIIEHCVVRVPDAQYPYRLLANKFVTTSSQIVRFYKSADGIHFEYMCDILNEKHDGQFSAVVRGNVIKLFMRVWDSAHTNRQVGVMYVDIDGNILTNLHIVLGDNLYNSASFPIDHDREILMPTWYKGTNVSTQEDMHLECYLLHGESARKLETNINSLIKSDEHWALMNVGVVSLNGQQYISYNVWKNHHYPLSGETRKQEMRIAKISVNAG